VGTLAKHVEFVHVLKLDLNEDNWPDCQNPTHLGRHFGCCLPLLYCTSFALISRLGLSLYFLLEQSAVFYCCPTVGAGQGKGGKGRGWERAFAIRLKS
jgi:hypothetical protein